MSGNTYGLTAAIRAASGRPADAIVDGRQRRRRRDPQQPCSSVGSAAYARSLGRPVSTLIAHSSGPEDVETSLAYGIAHGALASPTPGDTSMPRRSPAPRGRRIRARDAIRRPTHQLPL